jgi:hypothetical protein
MILEHNDRLLKEMGTRISQISLYNYSHDVDNLKIRNQEQKVQIQELKANISILENYYR